MNSNYFTFEKLCIRKENGFSFDLGTMFLPSNPNSFDDVVFKLISKIDTSLLLLKTHEVEIEKFTIIAIPISSQEQPENTSKESRTYQGRKLKASMTKSPLYDLSSLQDAWESLSAEGWDGLQSLALLQPESIPDTGSRVYSVYQFTTCVMDVIRANYMFQKFKSSFNHETIEMFDEADIKDATQAIFGLLWKRSSRPKEKRIISSYSEKRKSNISVPNILSPPKKTTASLTPLSAQVTRKSTQKESQIVDSREYENMEVDDEISFKQSVTNVQDISEDDEPLPPVQRGRRKTPKKEDSPPPPSPGPSQPSFNDITLGFETSVNTPKGSRKSMARKSLSSEWADNDRENILTVYDNLNPAVAEQKRIALTCKYVALHMNKELPSKLLYQWIQKKGRVVNRTIATFNIPEGEEQKQIALNFFRELNEENSETARISFTIKYMEVQYGATITSKQLYTWLNEKPAKKSTKKR